MAPEWFQPSGSYPQAMDNPWPLLQAVDVEKPLPCVVHAEIPACKLLALVAVSVVMPISAMLSFQHQPNLAGATTTSPRET